MKVAVILVLNDEAQEKINFVKYKMTDKGVPRNGFQVNHITLADVEIEDSQLPQLESVVEIFLSKLTNVNLHLESVGAFVKQKNVIFYSPFLDEKLININAGLCDLLQFNNIKCNPLYIKNQWQPHLTVGIKIDNNQLIDAFKIMVENNILPMDCICDKIQLLCHDPKPYKILKSYDLNN